MAHTCEVRDRVIYPCAVLESALEESIRAKGLSEYRFVRLDDPDLPISRSAIVLRSGDHTKRGIVLNFCPFCGEDIGSHLVSDDRAEVQAAAESHGYEGQGKAAS